MSEEEVYEFPEGEDLFVAPDAAEESFLDEGTYGVEGEARCFNVVARPIKGDSNKGQFYVDMPCRVDHPERGRVWVRVDPYSAFHTNLRPKSGSVAGEFLAGIGLSVDTARFSRTPDEKGNHPLIGANPCGEQGMKVEINVGLREYTDKSGKKRKSNYLKSIKAIG